MWMTLAQSLSGLWSLFLAFLDYFSRPYRLASSKPQEKDSRIWLSADEFARSTGIISNRVARLEEDFGILSSTCSKAARTPALDPSAERIKALEAELAETKKVRTSDMSMTFLIILLYFDDLRVLFLQWVCGWIVFSYQKFLWYSGWLPAQKMKEFLAKQDDLVNALEQLKDCVKKVRMLWWETVVCDTCIGWFNRRRRHIVSCIC